MQARIWFYAKNLGFRATINYNEVITCRGRHINYFTEIFILIRILRLKTCSHNDLTHLITNSNIKYSKNKKTYATG